MHNLSITVFSCIAWLGTWHSMEMKTRASKLMEVSYFYTQQTTDVNNVLGHGLVYGINELNSSDLLGIYLTGIKYA